MCMEFAKPRSMMKQQSILALSFDSKLPFCLQQETKGKLLDQGNKARRKNLMKMIWTWCGLFQKMCRCEVLLFSDISFVCLSSLLSPLGCHCDPLPPGLLNCVFQIGDPWLLFLSRARCNRGSSRILHRRQLHSFSGQIEKFLSYAATIAFVVMETKCAYLCMRKEEVDHRGRSRNHQKENLRDNR